MRGSIDHSSSMGSSEEAVHRAGEQAPLLKEEGVRSGEDAQLGLWDSRRDPPQVDRRYHRVLVAGCGQGGRGDCAQLTVIAVAAQPGVLGSDLTMSGRRGHVEVIGDFAALAGEV